MERNRRSPRRFSVAPSPTAPSSTTTSCWWPSTGDSNTRKPLHFTKPSPGTLELCHNTSMQGRLPPAAVASREATLSSLLNPQVRLQCLNPSLCNNQCLQFTILTPIRPLWNSRFSQTYHPRYRRQLVPQRLSRASPVPCQVTSHYHHHLHNHNNNKLTTTL